MRKSWIISICTICIGLLAYTSQLFFSISRAGAVNMPLANYYLNELNNSKEFIDTMSKFDVLIITPSQAKAHPTIVRSIREKNPKITIFAYVPSQSYNTQYWPKDNVFKSLYPKDSWWMRDTSGNPISHWPGLLHTNMSDVWIDDLLYFVEHSIMTIPGIDGIFFDMVSHNISWLNAGDIDINNDRKRDVSSSIDQWWQKRTAEFLLRARGRLKDAPIVINGTSDINIQDSINGRMFETFPTPWEGNGSWEATMNAAKTIQKKNSSPNIIIFNGNTNNTGKQKSYSSVRYGLASSLLLDDVYFSFDYGDQNHGQTWWYDEYDVNLGESTSVAQSQNGQTQFGPGVWQRQFEQGIAVVNSSNNNVTVSLPGEYEKIHGTQDTKINDGSIVSSVNVPAQDGLVLLRTLQRLDGILFTNGDFARFFKKNGDRVRNGFFVYDSIASGGAQVGRIDIDGNGKLDTVVATKNRITIRRDNGRLLAKFRPYGALFSSGLSISFGDINNDGKKEIVVSSGSGKYPIKLYSYTGSQIGEDWYPLGKTYTGGYSVAMSAKQKNATLVVASKDSTISLYDAQTRKQIGSSWSAFSQPSVPFVAIGNIDSSSEEEVVVGSGMGSSAAVKTYSQGGSLLSTFNAYSTIVSPGLPVQLIDVDTDGILDIVTLSSGF